MTYELFTKLLVEAKKAPNLDTYIIERGWQPWMNDHSKSGSRDSITNILARIYELGAMTIDELINAFRVATKDILSSAAPPYRTLHSWANGEREPASYMIIMMAYVVFNADA